MDSIERAHTHLVVFALHKGELKLVLGLVNLQHAGLGLAVKAEHLVAADLGDVDGEVDRADDPVVPVEVVGLGNFDSVWIESLSLALLSHCVNIEKWAGKSTLL